MRGDPQVKISRCVGSLFINLDTKSPESINHQGCVPGIKYAMQS